MAWAGWRLKPLLIWRPMKVLAYVTDLFVESKLSQIIQPTGAQLKVVSSLYKFLPEMGNPPDLVLLDLNAAGISPTSLLAQLRSRHETLPVVSWAEGDQQELMQQAREAGSDPVLDRSQLEDRLPQILEGLGKKK